MIPTRHSPDRDANDRLVEAPPRSGETNVQWLRRHNVRDGLLLLGGASLADFRIRVAQSHMRSDLLPGFWSLAGIVVSYTEFVSVPLELRGPASRIAAHNGVESCRLTDYDAADHYPNIAVIRFAENLDSIQGHIERVERQRAIVDLPGLMVPWLGFVWGAGQSPNPLLTGHGLPSASFVEAVYSLAGIELTPGISSASSSPEAIWQAAKWWHRYYAEAAAQAPRAAARPTVPTGVYALRQPAAAVAV